MIGRMLGMLAALWVAAALALILVIVLVLATIGGV